MADFVLGIDGGGSKTEGLLVDLETSEKRTLLSGGVNSIVEDEEASLFHLTSLIDQVRSELETLGGRLVGGCIGSASILDESNADRHWSVEELGRHFPGVPFKGVIDSRIALEGALNGKAGAVVVAGTGSIAYSIDEDGNIGRCGGWGPLYGDEGSGYWIGCECLRAVARHMDGRGVPTLLTERILGSLRAASVTELIRKTYETMGRKEIALLGAIAGRCAAEQDPEALRILGAAGLHLAELAKTIMRRTPWKAEPALSRAGGAFLIGEEIGAVFRANLDEWKTAYREPAHSPAYGAVLLAKKWLGA